MMFFKPPSSLPPPFSPTFFAFTKNFVDSCQQQIEVAKLLIRIRSFYSDSVFFFFVAWRCKFCGNFFLYSVEGMKRYISQMKVKKSKIYRRQKTHTIYGRWKPLETAALWNIWLSLCTYIATYLYVSLYCWCIHSSNYFTY